MPIRRRLLAITGPLIAALCAQIQPAHGLTPAEIGSVRLTVEIRWEADDPTQPAEVGLELTEGRIVEAVAVPLDRSEGPPPIQLANAWRLGVGSRGTVRVRVEAPVGASLLVKARGAATRFPIAELLAGPRQTGPTSPLKIRVERVGWDALEVHLAEGDGVVAPGSIVPMTLGFNILAAADPGEVGVRYWAELRPARGGTATTRFEGRPEVFATNPNNPPARVLGVTMPSQEGTYVLELHAVWEPVETLEGSRLTRLFHRRRGSASGSASRRITLVVLEPTPGAESLPPLPGSDAVSTPAVGPIVVDSIDLERRLNSRPWATGRAPSPAPGRARWEVPEAALDGPGLRARIRGGFERAGLDPPSLHLPPADPSGLAWAAVPLRVAHPGRPHRLQIRLDDGERPGSLGVALIVPGEAGRGPRVLLDAALGDLGSSTELVANPDQVDTAPASWLIWPDSTEPVLVLVNRGERRAVRVAGVELVELPDDPAPAVMASGLPKSGRALALRVASFDALDRFGGGLNSAPGPDVLEGARNFAVYLAGAGASAAVLPAGLIGERARRAALDGQAAEDGVGPDRLALTLRVLARSGLSAILELRPDGPLPGLPPLDSPEALARGLLRARDDGRLALDRAGRPAFQPLNPEVRDALGRLAAESIVPRLAHPNLLGLLITLGPGATLPGGPDQGLDDVTYGRFYRESVLPRFELADARRFPDPTDSKPGRFADRLEFLARNGREAWLDWRADEIGRLYGSLAETVRAAAPGAILAVATPGLDGGPAGDAARLADRGGQSPRAAWRAIGLDFDRWPNPSGGPIVLRTAELATEGLGRDLATSPDLDAPVAARPSRGLLVAPTLNRMSTAGRVDLGALPLVDDELFGHGLAVLDPTWVIVDTEAAAGEEARIARFSRVLLALPAPPEGRPATPRGTSGVAIRAEPSVEGRTILAMANDTPYEVLQPALLRVPDDTKVEDLGRGLRLEPRPASNGEGLDLVLRLPPFGVSAVRIDAKAARVESRPPVLPGLEALRTRADGLFARLGTLNQSDSTTAPPPVGFEPSVGSGRGFEDRPFGWSVGGGPDAAIAFDEDRPHAGLASLRLDARATGASAASPPFLPPGGTELTLRAWLRADRADALARIWVEGQVSGKSTFQKIDVPVGTDWTERRVLVPNLPSGGLDHFRVRFEWAGREPGSLWIDDVMVEGQGPGDSARQARRILADALQAYRQGRYAEFARLVASDRARQAAPEFGPIDPSLTDPGPLRTGQATGLPDPPRLR